MNPLRRKLLTHWVPWLGMVLAGVATAGRGLGLLSSHIERLSHFRLWWIGLLLGLMLWFLKRRQRGPAALAAVLMMAATLPLIGYWMPKSNAATTSTTPIKFIGWNLLWENPRHADALEWLKSQEADVILLTECTEEWRHDLTDLFERYPHRISSERKGAEGMVLLSRYPLSPPDPDGLSETEPKPWISTIMQSPDGPKRIIGLHPRVPRSGQRFDLRNLQYQKAARIASSPGVPVVVLGDFNCTPFSAWFEWLLDRGKLRDSALGYGIHSTWVSNGIGLPIDHVLISSELEVLDHRVHEDRIGSDHHPVIAVLANRPPTNGNQSR